MEIDEEKLNQNEEEQLENESQVSKKKKHRKDKRKYLFYFKENLVIQFYSFILIIQNSLG